MAWVAYTAGMPIIDANVRVGKTGVAAENVANGKHLRLPAGLTGTCNMINTQFAKVKFSEFDNDRRIWSHINGLTKDNDSTSLLVVYIKIHNLIGVEVESGSSSNTGTFRIETGLSSGKVEMPRIKGHFPGGGGVRG